MAERLAPDHYERLSWGDNLYRIGVAADGSCFFHALLMITDADYHKLNETERRERAVNWRKELARTLTIKDFIAPAASGLPLYKDLPEAVLLYKRDNYTMDKTELTAIEQELTQLHDTSPLNTFDQSTLTDFLKLYLAFREYLAAPTQSVGDELHLLLSDRIGYDIYLTAEGDNYSHHDPAAVYQQRRSLILYNVGGNHWEPVGQSGEQGLAMMFTPDAIIIQQLRKYNQACWDKLSLSGSGTSGRVRVSTSSTTGGGL